MSGHDETMKSSGGGASAKAAAVAGAVSATGNRYVDALTWGNKWDDSGSITYTFADDQRPWTDYERQAFHKALSTYESVIDVDFAEVSDAADANLVFHSVDGGTLQGALGMQAGPNGGGDQGQGYYNWQGDGWNPNGLEEGGFGYTTIVHELGHALGLAHPHDEGGGSPVFPKVKTPLSKGLYGLNQGLYTVMSYNDLEMKWSPSHPEAGYGFVAGPMAFDIAALQNIYGANNGFNTGDDVYQLPDFNQAGTFYAAIWDTSGIDTLNFDGSQPATLDLRPASLEGRYAGGHLSTAKKIYGGFIIANGVTIENANGGTSHDRIYGNDVDNHLQGNEGNDRLYGYFGNDTLDGGAGRDVMSGGDGDDVYYVDHRKDNVKEGKDGGTDIVYASSSYSLRGRHIEHLILTGDADVNATGNSLDNNLTGNDGDNLMAGKKGADTMAGGAGNDSYVVEHPDDSIIELPGEGIDSVRSTYDYILAPDLENLTLSGRYARIATGNDSDNILTGTSRGNQLTGGLGDDTMDGGKGSDTAFYDGDYADFTVAIGSDIITVTDINAGDGDEGADELARMEFLRFGDGVYEVLTAVFIPDGTVGNDTIEGSDHKNTLIGLAGDDTLSGLGGNDTLDGGDGNDSLDGGDGKDRMTGGMGDDTYIVDSKYDRVYEDAGGGTDTVISERSIKLAAHVENAIFTGTGKGSIRGNDENNVLTGGAGKAKIYGRDGDDTISSGMENDYVSAGDGADSVDAGDGNNKLYGGDGNDTISSGNGNDYVSAGDDDDSVDGGDGNNKIYGGDGNDTISTGNGNDYVSAGDGDDSVDCGDGIDKVYGGDGSDTLSSGGENDYVSAGDGMDSIDGGDGDDKIYGGDDDDMIIGGGGNDSLYGGRGDDTMAGGAGGDLLDGSRGDDRFVYADIADSGTTDADRDTIKYFDKYGDDIIDLSLIDADVNTGGDQAFTLIDQAAFSGTAGELRFAANLLQADVDGDGIADFEIAVGASALDADDFVL